MATYTLPELPYDYAALEPVINPQIIELHHDKHHAAYVKGANDTLEQLEEARDKEAWGAINGLQKNLAFHLSGHILHSIYWHNMTGDGGGEPLAADGVGDLADAITESFGSFAGFKSQLTKASATTQGSGWGVLAYEPLSDKLIVEQVYDHQGNVGQGSVP
ncbi:superoxide dismutase, partial [Streptomyces albus subsp. albus]